MADRLGSAFRTRLIFLLPLLLVAAGTAFAFGTEGSDTAAQPDLDQILRGRALVIEHACGGCHGGSGPASEDWLVGMTVPEQEFRIGPCATDPDAEPCFRTRPRNLTPDNLTGMGRFTERQIFNALRYGLRPGETADVEITSTTPGVGNFPEHPKYLAPPMPWPAWRHMPDEDLRAIAAYLKHGLAPATNRVADSEGPPDFWANEYVPENIGTYPAPPFPTAHEREPAAQGVSRETVLRGRQLVIQHDCGGCHVGGPDPAANGWLAGITAPEQAFPIGPCVTDPEAEPCFWLRPRNLTPDEATGIGRYSDVQIFNALRHGLRPSEMTNVQITGNTPGVDGFPEKPDYLGPGMPWVYWRHMADDDLRAIATYLRHGLRPVTNEVQASDQPPDLWASEFTVEKIGPYPAPPFPTAREIAH